MLALFSTIGWPLEDHPISHDHNNYYSAESSLLHFPTTLQPQFDQLDHSTPSTALSGGESSISSMVKKLNHNTSERDRRKKINNLYSSLRSLVPADHSKRLSIPATVSRVLKYIPELQQQVEGLIQKRDELLSKMSKQENVVMLQDEKQSTARRSGSSLSAVSTSRLSDTQVAIQISTVKSTNNFIYWILQSLEEDGLEMLSASTFESSGGSVFYNLHLQVRSPEFKREAHVLVCMRRSNSFRDFLMTYRLMTCHTGASSIHIQVKQVLTQTSSSSTIPTSSYGLNLGDFMIYEVKVGTRRSKFRVWK